MGVTQHETALARYRDEVTELIERGTTLGDIEDVIDEFADVTTDQKAALWLFAFTLRDRGHKHRDSGAHLLAVL